MINFIYLFIKPAPEEFIGDDEGNITGIRTMKVEWVKVQVLITFEHEGYQVTVVFVTCKCLCCGHVWKFVQLKLQYFCAISTIFFSRKCPMVISPFSVLKTMANFSPIF